MNVCVCVCVCARACVRACVCACDADTARQMVGKRSSVQCSLDLRLHPCAHCVYDKCMNLLSF